MKRAVAYLLSLLLLVYASAASAQVLISRVQTSGASATDEFIELYNASSTTAPLVNFSLKKQTAGGTVQILVSGFPNGTIINAFSYFLIAHKDNVPINNTAADFFYTNGSNSLADNNAVLLLSPSSTVIDSVFWGNSAPPFGLPAPNPSKNEALTRLPNDTSGNGADSDDSSLDFVILPSAPRNSSSLAQPLLSASEPTPLPEPAPTSTEPDPQPTETTTPELATNNGAALTLNEINSAPNEGNEWVELYNTATSTVDTTGLLVCDSASPTSSCKRVTGTVVADGFLVFDLGTSRYLNNDGDSVILKLNDGTIIDSIKYTDALAPVSGQTLARTTNNSWAITTEPTPGAANIITPPATTPSPAPKTNSGGSSSPSPASPSAAKTTVAANTTKTPKAVVDKIKIAFNLTVPLFAAPQELFVLSAAGSADPRGGAMRYTWDFGDGTNSTGEVVTHAFATSGTYAIVTSASSSAGTSSKTTSTITISPEFYTASGTVELSEIFANPTGDENQEFIELHNTSSSSVPLSLWRIAFKKQWYEIPEHTYLPANGFAVFYRTVTHLALSNNSETVITLTNAAGNEQNRVAIPRTNDGQSWARFGGRWQPTLTPTPGNANQLSAVLGESLVSLASAPRSAAATGVTIAYVDPENLKNKTSVFTTGILTTAPGIFGKRLIHLHTSEGGVLAQLPTSWSQPLTAGDSLVLTGVFTKTTAGKTYINVKTLTKTGHARLPSSTPISTIEVDDSIGKLVTIAGDITQVKGTTMYLDDGEGEILVALKTGAHVNKNILKINTHVAITGVLQENNGHHELWPRGDSDIEVLTPAPRTTTAGTAATAPRTTPTRSAAYVLIIPGVALLWALVRKFKTRASKLE